MTFLPPRLTGWAKRTLVREATKRLIVILEELKRSTADIEQSRTTIRHEEKSNFLEKKISLAVYFKSCCDAVHV